MIRFEKPVDPHFLRSAWPFWYMATPYTRFPAGHEAAYIEASKAAGLLLKAGVPIFPAIPSVHRAAQQTPGLDPTDGEFWYRVLLPYLRLSFGLIIVKMSAWDTSVGIGREQVDTDRDRKPILYMEWPQ